MAKRREFIGYRAGDDGVHAQAVYACEGCGDFFPTEAAARKHEQLHEREEQDIEKWAQGEARLINLGKARAARGKGKRGRRTAQQAMAAMMVAAPRKRKGRRKLASGLVLPHAALTGKCVSCGRIHKKGKHASHGFGSFDRTH